MWARIAAAVAGRYGDTTPAFPGGRGRNSVSYTHLDVYKRQVGTSSACGIFIGLGSALGYALQAPAGALPLAGAVGYVYLPAAIAVATTSVLAAPYGTRLAHALSGPMLKRVFALFLLVVGSAFAYSALH